MPSVNVTVDKLLDAVNLSLDGREKGAMTHDAQELQSYICDNLIFQGKSVELGGTQITRPITLKQSNTAQHTSQYGENQTTVTDLTNKLTCPWRFSENSTAWDLDEVAMCSGPEEIASLIDEKLDDMQLGFNELVEEAIFSSPTSATDALTPYGLPCWVVHNAEEGFTGSDPTYPSGGIGALSVDTRDKWKNYSGTYAAITSADLFLKMRRAAKKTNFKAPMHLKNGDKKGRKANLILANTDTVLTMERLLETRNDNLGEDYGIYAGKTRFMGNPILDIPRLDDTTDINVPTAPVYMLNTRYFYPIFLRGRGFKTNAPVHLKETQETVVRVSCRMAWNMFCGSRRSQTVFSTDT